MRSLAKSRSQYHAGCRKYTETRGAQYSLCSIFNNFFFSEVPLWSLRPPTNEPKSWSTVAGREKRISNGHGGGFACAHKHTDGNIAFKKILKSFEFPGPPLRLGGQGPGQRQGEAHPGVLLGLTGHSARLQWPCDEAAVVATAHHWR